MANTVSVSGLTDYVNNHRDELFIKATAGARSLELVEIMPNVKYKDALNYLDSEVVLADGSVCGWNPQGSDVFSERFVETKAVKVEKEFCAKDFEKKFANYQLMYEAGRETLPFEQKIAESNMNAIKKAVENLVWKGDATIGIDGWLAQASAETLTAKNLFMSYTDFRNYVAEQNASCCANRPILDAASESIKYVGDSRISLVPVAGLEGTGAMVASPEDGLVYGTDIEGSENVYKLWFEDKDEKFMLRVLFRAGTAIKHPEEIVYGA